ncbi:MAG: endonuclease MutS2 [Clostridiales bacterium]|nr:endonuclease MutS2 [Clostridiales bacterium]
MEEKTLRVLEFTKIRSRLMEYARSPLGKDLCGELVPSTHFSHIVQMQAETEEAMTVLSYAGSNPILYFEDITAQLTLAGKGGVLSPKALLKVAGCLSASRGVRAALVTAREGTPLLTQKAKAITPLRPLEQAITDAIIGEEEIADQASHELATIRRQMRRAGEKVREKLNQMIRSSGKYLQEPIVTMRNDRYVLPVKQEYRSQVPGLVHDQSSTGATFFIEPMAVVQINNELKEWAAKEEQEIERILAELSAMVAPEEIAIVQNMVILKELDVIFAKGALAREMGAVQPKMNEEGWMHIKQGRHPLIAKDQVVPIDLWMGKEFTTLVITGPNTGGKTVTLKTVGLFTLMMQAGLQVPAQYGTALSVFEKVYADIGDEQSIEQSLSTFSSHMTNIVNIMEQVTQKDLVLFDELGAGTDPTEGAALAQSILQNLLQKKIRTLATTHYSELKAFALATEGVENASVEFNIETLRPTYRLSIGIPGKSNAFEISRKLGLSESIIHQAKELISQEDMRFEDVIANAQYHQQIAEKERELAGQTRRETVRLRDEAEKLRKELETKREEQLKKAREEARRIVQQAKRESQQVISDLRKMRKEGIGIQEHEIQKRKKQLESQESGLYEGLVVSAQPVGKPPKDLRPGEQVEIVHLNTKGTVITKPDDKGEVQVQAGILKLNTHISQLRRVKENPKSTKGSQVSAFTGTAQRTVSMELDVRGRAVDEAINEIDMYLDEALLASLREVSIIHGKGTGTLRAGIHDHLRRHPQVKSYRLGIYGEGETGVTVVTLK